MDYFKYKEEKPHALIRMPPKENGNECNEMLIMGSIIFLHNNLIYINRRVVKNCGMRFYHF